MLEAVARAMKTHRPRALAGGIQHTGRGDTQVGDLNRCTIIPSCHRWLDAAGERPTPVWAGADVVMSPPRPDVLGVGRDPLACRRLHHPDPYAHAFDASVRQAS